MQLGKSLIEEYKAYKKIAINILGLGYILALPRTKFMIIECIKESIDELINQIDKTIKEEKD